MSGEIGIPVVLELKNGANAIHLSDFEKLTQSIEDAHLYRYLTNSTPIEPIQQHMFLQPLAQVVNENIQIIEDGVQIVNCNDKLIGNNMEIVDGNIQIVEGSGPVLDNKVQIVDRNLQIFTNNGQFIDNRSIIDNSVQIVTTNTPISKKRKAKILKKPQLKNDKNIKILNANGQLANKNVQIIGNNGINFEEEKILSTDKDNITFICEVVYPEQLNLKFQGLKRGRPKKKVVEPDEPEEPEPVKITKVPKSAPKTRSGRTVRFPKHIKKDFKKAGFEEIISENGEVEIRALDFEQYEEEPASKQEEKEVKTELQELKFTKRTLAAQYRCPKCQKAYLGKTKMIQHIKKYPDHGPLPIPRNENNFDVWNYLVDITQKCPPAQRGLKFCGELTNLLHNVLLLTSALFKEVEPNKTFVEVDKVLGNAIGLPPGQYKFNESELYKDVTVLKLITNTDFFKPVSLSKENNNDNKVKEVKEENKCQKDNIKEVKDGTEVGEIKPADSNCDVDVKGNDESGVKKCSSVDQEMTYFEENSAEKTTKEETPMEYQQESEPNSKSAETITKKETEATKVPDGFSKKSSTTDAPLDDRITVHQELLSENSLLHLPNLRTTVDDLMLTSVDTGGALLDNSTSSDEVMNVDQFVNERFKKITEPDLDISGGSLNLDLPPLDLFQFHTS